jgi:putative membrane protein insertion efficiency factor
VSAVSRVWRETVALPLQAYRLMVSPLLPPSCRFEPTCSAYAIDAILHHGALRGTLLALRRLLRCQPRSAGGYDPVPATTR